MPAYNAERYIEAAIRSVLAQTYKNLELIVVDDGSEDTTAEIVSELAKQDTRILLLQNEKNSGVSASRNTGVACAQGEWIAFLDSDDLWLPDKLSRQLAMVEEHPDAVLCYTATAFIDEHGVRYPYVMKAERRLDRRALIRRNLLSCSSVMVERETMLRHPMGGDHMHEDYAAWLAILREEPYAYGLDEPLLLYRLHDQSRSYARVRSAKMLYRTYRYLGYPAAIAGGLTLSYAVYSIRKRQKLRRKSCSYGPDPL